MRIYCQPCKLKAVIACGRVVGGWVVPVWMDDQELFNKSIFDKR